MSNARLVRVLVGAVYNDPDHRALPAAKPGDDIVIAGGDYADWLREKGMVVFVDTSDERSQLEREIADLKEHMDLLELEQKVASEVEDRGDVDEEPDGGEGLDDTVDTDLVKAEKPAENRKSRNVRN